MIKTVYVCFSVHTCDIKYVCAGWSDRKVIRVVDRKIVSAFKSVCNVFVYA